MNGLYKKVIKGVYPRIPRQYSGDLNLLISQLLTVDPKHRPSALQVLQMSCVVRKAGQMRKEANPTSSVISPNSIQNQLLSTIRVPKNLK